MFNVIRAAAQRARAPTSGLEEPALGARAVPKATLVVTAPPPKATETPEALQNKAAQRSDAKRSQTAASLPICLIAAIATMRFGSAIVDKLSKLS